MTQLRIDPNASVLNVETKQPGFRWPVPIDARLDGLVTAANAVGAATSRKELLAALVLTAPTRPATLRNAVLKLRVTSVRETALSGVDPGQYVLRKPGRPSGERG
jgi:hypothetical protein